MASLIKRGKVYHAQFYIGSKQKRVSLRTESYQIAKSKLRLIELKLDQGQTNPLPTKTPLPQAVQAYINHMRAAKAGSSVQKDAGILRLIFGPICHDLDQISRNAAPRRWERKKTHKKRRHCLIEAATLESITTSQISEFISSNVRSRGLQPRTANRYREVLNRLFNWSMKEGGVRLPNDKNPVADVSRYKQHAPEIRFLTLTQIDEQLKALTNTPQLQTMVAMLIYAGLRREESLWLTREDIDLKAGTNGMIRVQAKTINGQFWQPKTKVNRAVPISRALRSYLDRYTPRPSHGDWYFPSPQCHRYDPDNFSKELLAANIKAGLKWTCLDYRHTFGSQLAMKGESLYKISTLMGNSPEICRRHYASLIPESLLTSVEFENKHELRKIKG